MLDRLTYSSVDLLLYSLASPILKLEMMKPNFAFEAAVVRAATAALLMAAIGCATFL
jgi:hypothetical protein